MQRDDCATYELAQRHDEQLAICLALETLVDSLPYHVDPTSLRGMKKALVPVMHNCIAQWNLVCGSTAVLAHVASMKELLSDMQRQDQEDLGLAEEIELTLGEWNAGGTSLDPEAMAYLIRGFVTARRRRVALERALTG
ncbi:hypothetical protein [Devosia submarina]|uniref:hypothetical protein n=1 Tax=Devosia submarina TaxID=1173082 RepID=UPI000D3920A1|nr:hypothetical protein [Devosia submarina]